MKLSFVLTILTCLWMVGHAALAEEVDRENAPIDDFYLTKALEWSEENDGVGIGVSTGATSPYTAEELGERIRQALLHGFDEPIASAVFADNRTDTGGNAVSYTIRGNTFGTFSVEEAAKVLPDVVETVKFVRGL